MVKKHQATKDLESVDEVIAAVEKKFGGGSLQYGDTSVVVRCDAISTGAINLDKALGVWGIPKGRMAEVFGPESSGKTTLALTCIAQSQKNGGRAAFIDVEHALDKYWAQKIGVDISKLLISQPDSGEQAFEICEMLLRSKQFDIIVMDSVAALIPQVEIDGEMDEAHMGAQARLVGKAMRKFKGIVNKTNTCLVFINQMRSKIGVVFGKRDTTPGGRALPFYASVRIDIRRISTEKKGDIPIAQIVRAKVVKNKVAPPFESAEFRICFGKPEKVPPVFGIDSFHSLLVMAEKLKLIDKSGSWYSYKEAKIGNGVDAASAFLRENEDIVDEIRKNIMGIYKQVAPSLGQEDAKRQENTNLEQEDKNGNTSAEI